MKLPQSVNTLLNKPMDRKDFLQHVGIGALMLFGGGAVLQALTGAQGAGSKNAASAYGTSVYGGSTK